MRSILRFTAMIMAVSLICSATLTLTACHGRKNPLEEFKLYDDAGNRLELDTSKTIEISFWAKNDNNPTQVAIYKKAIADFEAVYPNIKVTFKPYADYPSIYRDVINNLSTDTTPNVCISYPDHVATYMRGKYTVVKLDELMSDEKYGLGGSELRFDSVKKEEMVPKFLEEGNIADGYYTMPFMRSTEACYINKTYVERLGYEVPDILTWDFIWEVSAAAMKKNADGTFALNGDKVMIPCIYKSTDNMMISMLCQKGAGYSTNDAKIEMFNDTTKGILYEIAENSGKRGSTPFSTFKVVSYPGNYFNAGQCLFAIDSTAGATWIGSKAPLIDIDADQLVDFETVVRPIPQYDTQNIKMISQGPSVCIFNKHDRQEVLASWLFVQFLLTNEVQIAYSQTEGYIPVTSKALESAEYLDYMSRSGEDNELYYDVKINAAKLFIENIENTFVTPVFAGSADLRNAAGQLVEEVVKRKMSREDDTVDDAFLEYIFDKVSGDFFLDMVRPIY